MHPVDVLVIAALELELEALRAVTVGMFDPWVEVDDDTPYCTATLEGNAGPFRVGAVSLTKMGGTAAAAKAGGLVERLRPRCIAMCGVCAGEPEDTVLGDVVIGTRVFEYDEGKHTSKGFQSDLWVRELGERWASAAQKLEGPAKGFHGYAEADEEAGRWWFLEQLLAERNPLKSSGMSRYLAGDRRERVLTQLRDARHVKLDCEPPKLSAAGRRTAIERRNIHWNTLTRVPYHIHVGPIGSGSAVVADPKVWGGIKSNGMRKILAVEMEAAAIGEVAHSFGMPFVVVKGVMDHGDSHKADGAKAFAARASAEVLCHFLRQVVVPGTTVVAEPTAKPPMKLAPTRLPAGAKVLFGRDEELAWLDRAWEGRNVATIVAWGGVGKTALVHEWRTQLLARAGEIECVFDWSFYSQGVRERGAVSADNFIREALRFFGDPELAQSNASPWDKGARLAELVGGGRSLLILDGLEPLQAPKIGALRENSIVALLQGLAGNNAGLCVVTTRVAVQDLERYEGSTAPRLPLEHLSNEAGAALLQSLLEDGAGPKAVGSTTAEREQISEAVQGHALTLLLLGGYIRRALGDVRRWTEIDFSRANEEYGGHAFRVMDAYVQWLSSEGEVGERQLAVLRLLGLFDRPADPGCLAVLREGEVIAGLTEALVDLDEQGWRLLVSSLEDMRLVMRSEYEPVRVVGYDEAAAKLAGDEGAPRGEPKPWRSREFGPDALVLDAHPLVREYFERELQRTNADAWREGHRRLYVYLCESVPYWPEGVEGLQPLYQAVAHGCSAGRIAEACVGVYWDRILRGARAYSTFQLGAIGADLAAVACFFERTWDRPSTELSEAARSWVLNEAAFSLRALGRLSEALEPMRAGLEMRVELGHWENAAISAGNLSELELTLGRTSAAVEDAAQSVEHADRGEDDFQRMGNRTALANARHQAGDLAGARELFKQAEAMQTQQQPTYPRLYSLQGYQYADLLLSPAERAAWRGWLGEATHDGELVTLCTEVFARATQTLAWAHKNRSGLLDVALDHLTLGRAALYAAMLRPAPTAATEPALSLATARERLDAAVDGLRNAGTLHHLPRGLIARAHLHHIDHRPNLARADLDEAWTVAERGPMPLFQADIQLTRARLLHDRNALTHARTLITRHEYNRRLPELTDAEHSAASWPR